MAAFVSYLLPCIARQTIFGTFYDRPDYFRDNSGYLANIRAGVDDYLDTTVYFQTYPPPPHVDLAPGFGLGLRTGWLIYYLFQACAIFGLVGFFLFLLKRPYATTGLALATLLALLTIAELLVFTVSFHAWYGQCVKIAQTNVEKSSLSGLEWGLNFFTNTGRLTEYKPSPFLYALLFSLAAGAALTYWEFRRPPRQLPTGEPGNLSLHPDS